MKSLGCAEGRSRAPWSQIEAIEAARGNEGVKETRGGKEDAGQRLYLGTGAVSRVAF